MDNDRWHTAVHEAGHAVVGRVLGMVCGPVTILADDDSAGHSITADPWLIHYNWELRGRFRNPATVFRGRIMAFMAGAEAEVALLGSCEGGDGDDRFQVALMLGQVGGPSERIEARLRQATRALAARHIGKIDRLAAALWTAETIEAEEDIRAACGLPPAPPMISDGLSAAAPYDGEPVVEIGRLAQ